MQTGNATRALAGLMATTVTIAAFAKTFVPFYLIGSTAIFTATCALGIVLVAVSWRPVFDSAIRVTDFIVLLTLLYGVIILSFLLHSRSSVPVTYLLGIMIFHSLFLLFGFAAARALKQVLLVLLAAAAIYATILIYHTIRFGDVMRGNNVDDVFGIGIDAISVVFHQNIGFMLSLGALAAMGLASNRLMRTVAICALAVTVLLSYYIAARTALVGLVSSLSFWGFATCWARSKKAATLGAAATMVSIAVASSVFYQHAMNDANIAATAPDAMSRTIRELQNPNPELRLQIWSRTWRHIVNEPNFLLFGRGVGTYPVNEGFGAPDWPIHPTEGSKHYPHNVHLEMLYESGIVGLLLYTMLTFFPLIVSLRFWHQISSAEKSIVSIYVLSLVSADISGAFAPFYDHQFFLALTIGIIAIKRAGDVELNVTGENFDPRHSAPVGP